MSYNHVFDEYIFPQQIQAYEDAMRQQRLSGWTRSTTKSCVKPPDKKKLKEKQKKKKAEVPPPTPIAKAGKEKPVKSKGGKKKEKEGSTNGGILKKKSGMEVTFVNPVAEKEEEALMPETQGVEIAITVECDMEDTVVDNSDTSAFEYKNDGYIELVLKVMARMCDGQNKFLQDYLREQPDNVKSFDIIAEVTRFLNVVYSNINSKNVDLVIQLFETMNEFTAGNQDNRVVIYDNKIIDYINFILRSGDFPDCSVEKILELRMSISNLVMSLIEENGPGATEVALEVKDTLDKKAVLTLMATCYERHQTDKTKIMELKALEEALADPLGSQTKVGGSTRNLAKMKKSKLFKGVMRVLREEVKEKLKWGVDRSSPSNKIRDLMGWTKDIMKDIAYQQKILKNPVAILLTKGWLAWNHMVTILSFAINILMLVTWQAKASLETPDIMTNQTDIPADLKNPHPIITTLDRATYNICILVMGLTHNGLSLLVFVSYFVCNHPRLPSIRNGIQSLKKCLSRRNKDDDDEEDKKRKHISKLDARFFSVTTFYYVAFLILSVLGTMSDGYFFAFHLLNIVNNNQLLSGVIKAVTQNGKSLLWVGVLGLVVFYLYAMIGFALMRSMFDPGEMLYCDSLWQCTITVVRYGLIGDLFEWTAESDMRDTCFICSRNSYDFEHHGKGFDHHVRHEHNMWAYIFFFIHLNGTKVNDYTALEMFVFKLLRKENYDFFPLDRALSLASMGKDATETKLDDLLGQVTSIVEKQRVEELEKKRGEERMKQKQWEQKHRLGSFRRRAKLPGSGPSDGPGGPGGSGGPGGAGGAGAIGDTQTLLPDDPRNMQLSPLPPTIGHPYNRRQSYGDYTGQLRASLGDIAARVVESRRPSITELGPGPRPSLGDIGARASLSDHTGRLAYLDSRRSSITEHGLSGYRQPPPSTRYDHRLDRQRTLRSMSPVRFDSTDGPSGVGSTYLRSHSRYDMDDPYVRSLSPVRYDLRSPARSRKGSESDVMAGITGRRGEVPTRDLSSLLSPRYPDSRQTSPRGQMTFFPPDAGDSLLPPDRLSASIDDYRGDTLDEQDFPPPPPSATDFPTRDRRPYSADYGPGGSF
ncbi:inositol 1,4,5-trisphosphate receptor type 1 [Elysia marginata]|uniref:Inositol 1,4,5-trisphosphate receptor type 1 n=1 Tax=Elysia marginata TaxID=1093978 RepID=A0AAV4EG62_9GAST|nr:inositol 1,4,5-trisphosphate receptor type 1 [Elysia marginata]